ncbi:hypothetical protein ABTK02_22340, partial [Acinetobacter baumannii]
MLVTECDDVESVLRPLAARHQRILRAEEDEHPRPPADPGEAERDRVVALLGPVPVSVDDIIRLSGLGVATVRIIVL